MSLRLVNSHNLEIKTWYVPDPEMAIEGSTHIFELYGKDTNIEVPISKAVSEIKTVFDDADPAIVAMSGLKKHVMSLVPQMRPMPPRNIPAYWLAPTQSNLLSSAWRAAEGGEQVTFFERKIDPQDYVDLVNHVMVKTYLSELEPSDENYDSRLAMIEQMRVGQAIAAE